MASSLKLQPLKSLRVSRHQIPAVGLIPNTSIQGKPLLIYHKAFASEEVNADGIERHLTTVAVVQPQWRYTMYSTTHFHSTTHEVLCIASGRATCLFGGEGNSGAVEAELNAGDVVIVPAGVGHRLLRDAGGHFQMVGSYPAESKSWDMCYGHEGERDKIAGISQLGWFKRDPLYGDSGPCLEM